MQEIDAKARADLASGRRFLRRSDVGRRSKDHDAAALLNGNADAIERATPGSYLFLLFALLIIGAVTLRSINAYLAPLLMDFHKVEAVASKLSDGKHYTTYDLNIETRALRRAHIRGLAERPELAVMGASHWQEADGEIAPGVSFYNAHVHRDYYEDIVAVAGWFYTFDRLPKRLIISIRDNQFTPPEARTDFLWVPVLPWYRELAPIFGLTPHNEYSNGLTPQVRQGLSLPLLKAHLRRYLDAPEQPHVTDEKAHPTLDTLLPDGGIFWSQSHRDAFTEERTLAESMALADAKRFSPPIIDPVGVETVERVLKFLRDHGVEVILTHPPFNPQVWDSLEGSPYMPGLARVEALVADMADRLGLRVIGSFNPHEVGCTADMYIDGEHSSPDCLGRIIAEAL